MEEGSSTYETSSLESGYSSSYGTSDDNRDEDHPQVAAACFEQPTKQRIFSPLDPYQYISPTFYSFDERSYALMKFAIQSNTSTTLEALKEVDARGILNLKRWRKMKDNLCLEKNDNGIYYLCFNLPPKLKISYIEEWENIVQECHIVENGTRHLEIDDTFQKLKSIWCVDVRRQGIPTSYVKDLLNSCECARWTQGHKGRQLLGRKDSDLLLKYEKCVDISNVDQALVDIMIEHKVRLVMVRSSKTHGQCKTTFVYACHRGRNPRRQGTKKRIRRSKRCGCPFKVRVQQYSNTKNASIHLHPIHEGHIPGTREDLYHLPVHPKVIECCMEDLFDVGSPRHVAKMSLSKERLHFERSSPVDQVIYRFFMIQREISMMSYQIRSEGNIDS